MNAITDQDYDDLMAQADADVEGNFKNAVALGAIGVWATKGVGAPLIALGFVVITGGNYAAKWAGAKIGRYGDCFQEQCPSCEEAARAKAIRDEIQSYIKPACNINLTPTPDGVDKCYDQPGGLYGLPQVAVY